MSGPLDAALGFPWMPASDATLPPIVRRQRRLIAVPSLFLGFTLAFFTAFRIVMVGDGRTIAINLAVAAYFLATPLWMRLSRGTRGPFLALWLGSTACFVAIAWKNGGLDAPALLGLTFMPAVGTAAVSVRAGVISGFVNAALLLGLLSLHQGGHVFATSASAEVYRQTRAIATTAVTMMFVALVAALEANRARAEHDKSEVAANYHELVEGIPDGVSVVADGVILHANHHLEELLDAGPLVGRALEEVLPRGVTSPLKLTADDTLVEPRLRWQSDDGEVVVRVVSLGPMAGDQARGELLIWRDVSQQDKLERELELRERLSSLGILAAGVAHEVNNPLTYVLSNLQYVIGQAESGAESLDPEVLEALRDAREGAERVGRIASDLGSLAQGEEAAEATSVDLPEVITQALKIVAHITKHRARVSTELAEVPFVEADEGRLTQALVNVIANAAHAIPAGDVAHQHIEVACFADGDRVVIEVSDSGQGIPEGALAHVFDPFFSTKRVGEGMGMGLSIARSAITKMGGTLTLENLPEGGALARITLLATDEEPARNSSVRATRATEGTSVLIVDDEPRVGRTLARMLGAYDTHVFVDPEDALSACEEGDYAAILCDVMMPQMTARAFYERLRERAPGTEKKVVFMTAGAFTKEARDLLDEVPNTCVRKPLDPTEVLDEVERLGKLAS